MRITKQPKITNQQGISVRASHLVLSSFITAAHAGVACSSGNFDVDARFFDKSTMNGGSPSFDPRSYRSLRF